MKTFDTYHTALAWARTFAREHCHTFHYWKVELVGVPEDIARKAWVVAVYSRNTDALSHFVRS